MSNSLQLLLKWGSILFLALMAGWQFRKHPVPSAELVRRVPRCVMGLICFGVGIALFFKAGLGTAPWDVFHAGVAKVTKMPVGLAIIVIGLLILLLWIPLKERIGLGTVLNAILIGIVVDIVKPRIHQASAVWLQVFMVLAGTTIIAVGSGFYIGSGLGEGPRDGLMVGLAKRGISIRVARTGVEAGALVAGLLMGGRVGFGTIAFLVLIGPLVQFFMPRLALPKLPSSPHD